MRLNKFISESGKASRRGADKLIEEGRVKINGRKAKIGDQVKPGDEVMVNGQRIRLARNNVYLALNKPVGITCTTEKNVKGNISFDNVSFRYNDNAHRVLKHINLDINAGEYVALVGSSGAGKSTLCNLIPRFYEVSDGKISVDGQDIRNIKLNSLRKNIGMVQQDVYLFAGTIFDNIKYGRPDATKEEVIEAAKEANAYDFIMSLPKGFDTDIGQRGIKLSGGQKQRLSIARVFLKNPPILIFDEATSALDNESEKIVQKSMEKLAKNRTTLVIAHRLSTIRNAKKILVLTENGIEEQGTHEELMEKQGIYYDLYKLTKL